jgi:hypothetical protein
MFSWWQIWQTETSHASQQVQSQWLVVFQAGLMEVRPGLNLRQWPCAMTAVGTMRRELREDCKSVVYLHWDRSLTSAAACPQRHRLGPMES